MTKFTVRTLEKFDQECSRRTIIVDFIFIRKARILAVLHESMQPCKNQVRLQSTNHLYCGFPMIRVYTGRGPVSGTAVLITVL